MNNIKNMFFGLFFLIFTQGCATVGMAIDGGKELVVNTIDTTVTTGADMVGALAEDTGNLVQTGAEIGVGLVQSGTETTSGLVKVIRDEIDEQTDALQDPKEEKPEKEKK